MANARYAHTVAFLGGEELFEKVRTCRILVVGAGGIGCELLKNLVLVGCETLTTVDLDTIDVSNLNRQFLFRRAHVGRPKALVAAETALRFNSRARVDARHANIKDGGFDLAWFGSFDVVINALDNVDARRHVNRMCLAADRPLIEAGTTGFLGQVFSIRKGETACYECFPKATRVVYPICTIRSTPSEPVHCVVWAKELFRLLFGDASASMLHEAEDGPDASVYAGVCAALREADGASADAATGAALAALCDAEVAKQLSMDKYKTAKRSPTKLDGAALAAAAVASRAPSARKATADWDRAVWSVEECCAELAAVSAALLAPRNRSRLGSMAFDKDDDDAMRFVAAAANLRSRIFHIAPESLYATKGIAGNIVPAIATTNAVVAGLQVTELLKLIKAGAVRGAPGAPRPKLADVCSYTYCLREPTRRGLLLQPTALEAPQRACYVCRKGKVAVALDTANFLLRDFVDVVLKRKLGFASPAVDKGDSGLVDADDERLEANLALALDKLPGGGVSDGTVLTVSDFVSDLELDVVVRHRPESHFDEKKNAEKILVLSGPDADAPLPPPDANSPAAAAPTDAPAEGAAEAPPAKRARRA